MINTVIAEALLYVAKLVLKGHNFDSILLVVRKWAQAKVDTDAKRHGAFTDILAMGLELTNGNPLLESDIRFGIELAVKYLQRVEMP